MCLALLMRYPQPTEGDEDSGVSNITSILDTADKIRKGTFNQGAFAARPNSVDRRSVNGRRKSFNNRSGGGPLRKASPAAEPPVPPTDADKSAIDALLASGGNAGIVSDQEQPCDSSAVKHKDSVNSWLNATPSLPLFLSDGIEAGKKVASSATSALFSHTGAANKPEQGSELFPAEQPQPKAAAAPRIRKRDIIKALIIPGAKMPTVGDPLALGVDSAGGVGGGGGMSKDQEDAGGEQEFSLSHTSIAMVDKAHPQPTAASMPMSLQSMSDSLTHKTAKQQNYDSMSMDELVEDRLRTLSELLRSVPTQPEAASALKKGSHSHSHNTISNSFIADKMELLADVLGGLYSVPEYDNTFMTLVSGPSGNNSGTSASASESESASFDRDGTGGSISKDMGVSADDPLGAAKVPVSPPVKKKSVLIGSGYGASPLPLL